MGRQYRKKRDELGGRVSRCGLAKHGADVGVKGGTDRESSIAVILKTVSLGTTGREQQQRVLSLNSGLPIDTKRGRMLRVGFT
ncbi:MAG TPA: hypothetical protein PLR83_03385 [Pyrinomonadaceae bacterium]|nr:hypothetical protein [Pyrinomonadaceae bacterium]